jgi:DNA-binding IclR family transcriptional regulator
MTERGEKASSPAVTRAVQILDYLANSKAEAGVTEIASALDINKSTCFNILRALADEAIVIKDARFPIYRLGPRLVELGTASRRNFSQLRQIMDLIRPLVEDIGVTCIIAQPIPGDRGFVVLDRVVPRGADVLTVPIGHSYPLTSPAMGRAFLGARDLDEVISSVHNRPDVSEAAILNLAASLDRVREAGYGWSDEEYQHQTNAVAVAVTGEDRSVVVILCLVGHVDRFGREKIDGYGRALVAVGREVEMIVQHNRRAITTVS